MNEHHIHKNVVETGGNGFFHDGISPTVLLTMQEIEN